MVVAVGAAVGVGGVAVAFLRFTFVVGATVLKWVAYSSRQWIHGRSKMPFVHLKCHTTKRLIHWIGGNSPLFSCSCFVFLLPTHSDSIIMYGNDEKDTKYIASKANCVANQKQYHPEKKTKEKKKIKRQLKSEWNWIFDG